MEFYTLFSLYAFKVLCRHGATPPGEGCATTGASENMCYKIPSETHAVKEHAVQKLDGDASENGCTPKICHIYICIGKRVLQNPLQTDAAKTRMCFKNVPCLSVTSAELILNTTQSTDQRPR